MKSFLKNLFIWIDRIASIIEWRIKTLVKKTGVKAKHNSALKNFTFLLLSLFLFCIALFVFWVATLKTPNLSSFDDKLLGQSAKIYDRTGAVLLYDLGQKVRRTVVPLEEMSPYLKSATVAIEDADFYKHNGIQITSILRAIIRNITSFRFSQGGSTITQQVIKNSLLTNEKDISRKIKEWILAVKLEKNADKNTILELYLNNTPYGGNIYGAGEASMVYFGKKPVELTLAEAAYLAALPQAPSLYSPYGKNKNLLIERKNLVLKKMLEHNLITVDTYKKVSTEEVVFLPKSSGGIKAPHFVMYLKDYLEQTYGSKLLEVGGLKIISTLDWDMQQQAEKIVKDYVLKNGPTFKASNAALVATNPKTGEILTMVGSRDYFDKEIDGNFNVATAYRQPGSAFKPFVIATAFNKGLTPETPLYDVPTQFNASCNVFDQPTSPGATCYNPQNYEGGYKGLVSIRSAVGQSRNIPLVRLSYIVGINDIIKTASSLGISKLASVDRYGLSLALGGAEVTPLDMASAYGVFANSGKKAKTTGIIKIINNDGVEIESIASSTKEILPRQSALLVNDVLADPVARAPIFGTNYFGNRQVAIKSGTTNDSRDAWVMGYTPSISVSSWMGNNDNSPMVQQASARIIGPMWKKFMDWVLENKVPEETFDKPEKTDENIKPFIAGVWKGPNEEVHSELFWLNKNDIKGNPPGASSNDSLFNHFEYGVSNWMQSPQGLVLSGSTPVKNSNTTLFNITSPQQNIALGGSGRTIINVSGTTIDTTQVEYYINGVLIGKSTEAPFSFSFIPSSIPGIEDENEIKAIATQRLGKFFEAHSYFSVVK